MSEVYQNYIGGQWVSAVSGQTFDDLNPADTTDLIGRFPRSDARDVDRAVQAAREGFAQWRRVPAPRRAEAVRRAGEILRRRKDEIGRLMTREMGKVLTEALGDVQEGIDTADYMAGEGRRLFGVQAPCELPQKLGLAVRVPVGVVAVITPWNFPLAIPTWKIFPALVCGNAVVFKPAEDTPLLATVLVEILTEAGLPGGVVSLVHGIGEEAGDALVRHPGVDLVSFTGSTAVGRQVATICAAEGKKVSLEMGGKNAIIVMDDAALDLAVDGAVWGGFGTTGQRCTAASRVIVHEAVAGAFTDRFVERARRLRLGSGLEPSTDVGPVINARQLQRIHEYTRVGRSEGARVLIGGEPATDGALARGHFYRPTIFADVEPAMRVAREEIFGPSVAVLRAKSFDQAIEIANATSYGLSSAIYTRDIDRAFRAIEALATGIIYVNASTIGAEVQFPFGGVRQTGNGHREGGWTVLDIMTEWKTVYVDYSGRLQRAQIDSADR
ncbi:MAG: aldehyde dehydrogenase family protein [Candidatus Rokubacteria bacterium]|nr:aldehyde dehydrogenase family protein [Candidatus Rokubacteria bacterium]